MSRILLDTSVLIGSAVPADVEGAISSASLAELYFGALVAGDPDERADTADLAIIDDLVEARAP